MTLVISLGIKKKMVNCHRCGEAMRIATKLAYDFQETREMDLKGIDPIPYKVYLVCDNCYLGQWYDSRDLE